MALSPRERSQRSRAHHRGDHSFCPDPARCERDATPYVADAESATEGVRALLAVTQYPEDDPRAVLSVVAVRLAERFDAEPSAAMARELRGVLGDLSSHPNEPPGIVDELRARYMARQVEGLLRSSTGEEG